MMTHRLNGTGDRPPDPPLSPAEYGVLECCREVTVRNRELLPLLAEAVGVAPGEVFAAWTMNRKQLLDRCGQHGRLGDTGWGFFFHGAECDLSHSDGRFLRIDFGPGGRVDTFTAWGVLQFIMTARAPWPEFPDLQREFAEGEPPFDQYSGSLERFGHVWDSLLDRGAFEPAARDLVEFQARHTTVGPDGISYTRFPAGTPESVMFDCSVAHRPVLSAVGRKLLQDHPIAQPEASSR